MTRRALAAAVVASALVPATASAGSIVYVEDGNVRVVDDATQADAAVTSGGGWEAPSQAADGTIVAVHGVVSSGHTNRSIVRLGRDGAQLGPPVVTVEPDSSANGPFDAKVSPDGSTVAYWFNKPSSSDRPIFALAHADRDTPTYEIKELSGHWHPFWLDGSTVATFAVGMLPHVITYRLGTADSAPWFSDPEGIAPAAGDASPDGTRLATAASGVLRLYAMSGPPPAEPAPTCVIEDPATTFLSPTWSPDGRELAWAQEDGIHVASVPDVADCAAIQAALVIPGGKQPDWGPAAGPSAAGGAPTMQAPKTVTRSRLRSKGVAVTVACPQGCAATVDLLRGTKRIARVRRTLAAGTATTIRVKARVPKTTRKVKLRVKAGGASFVRTIRIRG